MKWINQKLSNTPRCIAPLIGLMILVLFVATFPVWIFILLGKAVFDLVEGLTDNDNK